MESTELIRLTALEQAALIKARKLSSEELTQTYLRRIERLNPRLHAFVSVFEKGALKHARAKDAQTRKGSTLPAFHGVPMGIKDLNFVRWHYTRMGSRAFNIPSPVDDVTVRHLRRAGFVMLGKTATSEMGAMPVTEPDIHPPTRNPWNPDHSSGGSSGGAGSAVAAGMLPIAHGSDGAGSIRIPSSFCHLYGIKATRGRVPNAYGLREHNILYTCGPLARSVSDAAAMLDVMLKDPAAPSLLSAVERAPGKRRIRFVTTSPLGAATPEIETAVRGALKLLETLGHTVEEGTPPTGTLSEFLPMWQRLSSEGARFGIKKLQPVTRWLVEAGRKLDHADVERQQDALNARLTAWWGDTDIWVSPTLGEAPPRVGQWKDLPAQEAFEKAARLGAFTAVLNVTGQPAVSIPLGVDGNGLPMGLQLAARNGEEALLISLSRQLEEAMPWRQRLAPLFTET